MKRNYPEFLLEEFGNDLQDIFGSVEEQENKIAAAYTNKYKG